MSAARSLSEMRLTAQQFRMSGNESSRRRDGSSLRTRAVEVSSPLFKREQPNTLRVLYFVAVSYIPPKWRCPLCSSSNVRCVPRRREGDKHDPEWTLYQCKSCDHMWHRHKPAFGKDAGAAT